MINKHKIAAYFWQPMLVCVFILLLLYVMRLISASVALSLIGTSSLGSTAFIVFSQPTTKSANPSSIWGGYMIGILSGLSCFYLSRWYMHHHGMMTMGNMYIIAGAIAIALAMAIMCVAQLSHPPAAGMALALVMEPWDYKALTVVLLTLMVFTTVKQLLKPYLQTIN